jgi:hypothetical protein
VAGPHPTRRLVVSTWLPSAPGPPSRRVCVTASPVSGLVGTIWAAVATADNAWRGSDAPYLFSRAIAARVGDGRLLGRSIRWGVHTDRAQDRFTLRRCFPLPSHFFLPRHIYSVAAERTAHSNGNFVTVHTTVFGWSEGKKDYDIDKCQITCFQTKICPPVNVSTR